MSNPAALLHSRNLDLGTGAYVERAETRASDLEYFLNGAVSHLPRLSLGRKRRLARFVGQVRAAEPAMQARNDTGLRQALALAGARARAVGLIDAVLVDAFAVVREASRRRLGMRHHDVQLLGGWALLNGMIAEMQTGEGKTLAATLAACTAAGAGAATHIVTVNDYLAARDAEANGPLYEALGLTVGVIGQDMSAEQRREIYRRDIVYVSNKEIVFDYLKDRIALKNGRRIQFLLQRLRGHKRAATPILRGLHYAIVDEADSVLADEARTPLIISETESDGDSGSLYTTALDTAAHLSPNEHFVLTATRELWLTAPGRAAVGALLRDRGDVWRSTVWREELIQKALTAKYCFHRDEHYIVSEGKVQIVDEFTGRVMPDRSWEQGLHQMIEAKEGCELTGKRRTLSRMTYQRFFQRYLRLGGMTGTGTEISTELRRVYGLEVLRIPTHLPPRRTRLPDRCWLRDAARWVSVADRAEQVAAEGRAVLIGTRSVQASERLAEEFAARGLAHAVLNARHDKEEAEIVAQAGQPGRITIATNMAGRGTDIKLSSLVRERGGLHVILTEFNESRRIDRQLFGRCARQGDPGTIEAAVSLEDELFRRYSPRLTRLVARLCGRGDLVPGWLAALLVRSGQRTASASNLRTRMATLREDRKLERLLSFSGGTG
ncbi:MAG: prepilin peptidase [Gammaproteobacteria bacterium]|nr:prepilin peptidase [Gammaproteobacteria bacterium]